MIKFDDCDYDISTNLYEKGLSLSANRLVPGKLSSKEAYLQLARDRYHDTTCINGKCLRRPKLHGNTILGVLMLPSTYMFTSTISETARAKRALCFSNAVSS